MTPFPLWQLPFTMPWLLVVLVVPVLALTLGHLLRLVCPQLLEVEPNSSSKDITSPRANKRKRRVAIVGAGPAGIVMLREMLAEGHDAVAFEASDRIGGVFAKCYDECQLTSSSLNTAFSSMFPSKGEPHVYWTAGQYVDYLKRYVERFDLGSRIYLNTRVTRVASSGPPTTNTGSAELGWEITVEKSDDGSSETETFDHVAVCSGVHASHEMPHFDGQVRLLVSSSDYTVCIVLDLHCTMYFRKPLAVASCTQPNT